MHALYINHFIKLSQKSYEKITALIPIGLRRNWVLKSEMCHTRSLVTVSDGAMTQREHSSIKTRALIEAPGWLL